MLNVLNEDVVKDQNLIHQVTISQLLDLYLLSLEMSMLVNLVHVDNQVRQVNGEEHSEVQHMDLYGNNKSSK